MHTHSGEVTQFFKTLKDFKGVVEQSHADKHQADLAQNALSERLAQNVAGLRVLNPEKNIFHKEINALTLAIEETLNYIETAQGALKHRIQVQTAHQDKLIMLIFGKVNSGKSSFSNYLVSLCQDALQTEQADYFYFKDGEKCAMDSVFKEGSVETTAQIQGVEIGNLLLLDSPGLHSVTEENGALTQQYSDSADLVLWMTGSNSPGQTQELDELKAELNKGKVLFPVITKSDRCEEDEVMVNGQPDIVQVLSMKTPETQGKQQEDVYQRSLDKLSELEMPLKAGQLKKPVSISTYYAKEYAEDANVLEDAGIDSLFEGLNSVYQEAISYKKDNIQQQVKHYTQEIQQHLTDNTLQPFIALDKSLTKQIKQVEQQLSFISESIINQVALHIPQIVSQHESTRDIKAIEQSVLAEIEKHRNEAFETLFAKMFQDLKKATVDKVDKLNIKASFEEQTIEYEEYSGSSSKSILQTVLTVGGAALGALGGPAGMAAGGAIGNAIGGAVGSKTLVDSNTVSEVVGVDSSQLEAELHSHIKQVIPEMVKQNAEALLKEFSPLQAVINSSLEQIKHYQHENR